MDHIAFIHIRPHLVMGYVDISQDSFQAKKFKYISPIACGLVVCV